DRGRAVVAAACRDSDHCRGRGRERNETIPHRGGFLFWDVDEFRSAPALARAIVCVEESPGVEHSSTTPERTKRPRGAASRRPSHISFCIPAVYLGATNRSPPAMITNSSRRFWLQQPSL